MTRRRDVNCKRHDAAPVLFGRAASAAGVVRRLVGLNAKLGRSEETAIAEILHKQDEIVVDFSAPYWHRDNSVASSCLLAFCTWAAPRRRPSQGRSVLAEDDPINLDFLATGDNFAPEDDIDGIVNPTRVVGKTDTSGLAPPAPSRYRSVDGYRSAP